MLRRPFTLILGTMHLLLAILIVGCNAWAQTNPVPFISVPLSPDAAPVRGGAFNLTVNGTGFVPGSIVKWNTDPRTTTFINSGQVTAAITETDIANMKTAVITVTNPGPGGGTSSDVFFPVLRAGTTRFRAMPVTSSVGSLPARVVAGDFNDDGKVDLATPNTSPDVSILLAHGDGTFTTQTLPVQATASGLATGDFNGDGEVDLIAGISSLDVADIFLGNGDGTFTLSSSPAAGASPCGFAPGDFDGNGTLDIAVANCYSDFVSILIGNGDGTFQEQRTFATGSAPAVATGDFNGDNKLDLVVTNDGDSSVSVFLGAGDGTFGLSTVVPQATPEWVVVADFNLDGYLDFAASNWATSTVSVSLGNGDGSFQPRVAYATGSIPNSVVAGDFNGDGILDLATANFGASEFPSFAEKKVELLRRPTISEPDLLHSRFAWETSIRMGDWIWR